MPFWLKALAGTPCFAALRKWETPPWGGAWPRALTQRAQLGGTAMAQMPTEQVALALASLNALRAECAVAQDAFDAFVAQTGDLGGEIRGLSLLPHAVVRAAAGTPVVDPGGLNRNLTLIETALMESRGDLRAASPGCSWSARGPPSSSTTPRWTTTPRSSHCSRRRS